MFFHPAIVHRIKLGKVNFGLLKDLLKTDGIEYELVINGFYVSRDIINEYIENEIYNGKELARSR